MRSGSVAGRTVVVSGAASGIGRALALELSARGAVVALGDVDMDGLEETVARCPGPAAPWCVDVSDRAEVEAWAEEVRQRFGQVHHVYNNAGIGFNALTLESSWSDYERVLRVNLAGVVHGTQAFLPHLIASGSGQLVNMSSLNGLLAQPTLSHYCASKFAVRGFTEAVRSEMQLRRHPVRVTVVHPGGVATRIHENALAFAQDEERVITEQHRVRARIYGEKLLTMDPATAARIIVRGVEKGRERILVGRDAVAADLLVRLAPVLSGRVAVSLDRRLFPPG